MKARKWCLRTQQTGDVARLANELNISPITARLLLSRGYDTSEKVRAFLCKSIDTLADPFLMKDMDKAVVRINEALAGGEMTFIYGDYDVDGVTSTAILYKYLKSRGGNVSYYIPDRAEEGYGVNLAALRNIAEKGGKLLITVDSGITAIDEIEYAQSLGICTIVTDHHECKDVLPDCCAVINPKRPDCGFPFKELAGVGVVLKLICALEGRENLQGVIDEYCELAAFGTIADVMPLLGENRVIVALGLKRINNTKNTGLAALINRAGLAGKKISAGTIGYTLAPRINAAGRIGCASRAVELFLTEDPREAAAIAQELCEINRQRQDEENTILKQTLEMINADEGFSSKKVIVLANDGWHHGVIGIVASRLSDRYYLPSILISFDGDTGKGSGRSIKSFNLYEAIESVSANLVKFGGHALAAGLTISRENLAKFERDITEYAEKFLTEDDLCPTCEIDSELPADEINIKTVADINYLEPYGMGNPAPQFLISAAKINEIMPLGNDKHAKLTLVKEGNVFQAIYFGKSTADLNYHAGDVVDVICNLDINTYRGEQSLQVSIKDMRKNEQYVHINYESAAILNSFMAGKLITPLEAAALIPNRDEFVTAFRFITSAVPVDEESIDLYYRSGTAAIPGFSFGKFLTCIKVFEEAELIELQMEGEHISITLKEQSGKKNLDNSETLSGLKRIRAGKSCDV